MTKIFVYGTLKRGHGNNYLLGESPLLGQALTLTPFVLFNCGFPMAVPFTRDAAKAPLLPVMGEVYQVDETTLRRLDSLEGHPDWYERKPVQAVVAGKEQEVELYVMPDWQSRPLSPIMNDMYCWTGR